MGSRFWSHACSRRSTCAAASNALVGVRASDQQLARTKDERCSVLLLIALVRSVLCAAAVVVLLSVSYVGLLAEDNPA